jgi:hypothetical protein
MNWSKAVIAGVVGGVALNLADWVMHGMIMASAYSKYPVFSQEEANPLLFLAVALCLAIPAALLFAKTRSIWADGLMGGATYGFWLGVVFFFANFYDPLVLEGFPYHLAWCWGGIQLIGYVIMGAVFGLILKKT